MKKFISFILCLIILISVLPGTVKVHAAEEEQQDEVNEYYLDFLSCESIGSMSQNGTQSELKLKYINQKVVGYYYSSSGSSWSVRYLIYDSAGSVISKNDFMVNLVKTCSSWSGSYKDGSYSYESGSVFWVNIESESNNGCTGRTFWNTPKPEESGYIKTNIPLFSDEETARAFINGTVDITQAENFESDILNKVKDSNEVPMPRNLRIEHEDYRYYLIWEYSSEDLKKLSFISVDGIAKGIEAAIRNSGEYTLVPDGKLTDELQSCVELKENLVPCLSYKLDITDDITRLRHVLEDREGVKYDYRAIVVYKILARWDKSVVERYYSNFARVKLYISDSDEGFKVDFDTSVTDSEGNVLDDVQFNTGLGSVNAISSNDFIGNIASGFKLLGDNGLIALLTSTLSFIPSPLWMIIGTALSIMVIVALFKLVIK